MPCLPGGRPPKFGRCSDFFPYERVPRLAKVRDEPKATGIWLHPNCLRDSFASCRNAWNRLLDFQDDFDLDQNGGPPRNNFDTVAEEIQKKYPEVVFTKESFAKGEGDKKLARVEEFLAAKKPVIVSLSNVPFGQPGWHIMVVVDESPTELTLLEYVDQQGKTHTRTISKTNFAAIHNNFDGGDEIAFLERVGP